MKLGIPQKFPRSVLFFRTGGTFSTRRALVNDPCLGFLETGGTSLNFNVGDCPKVLSQSS